MQAGEDVGEIDEKKIGFPSHSVTISKEGEEDSAVAKLRMDEGDDSALLAIEPADLKGSFDFIIDVESMSVTADDERKQSRQAAVSMLATNPNVTQMLASEQYKPKFKSLFVTWLEDLGFSDAERYFEKVETPQQGPAGAQDIMAQLTGRGGRPPSPEGAAGGAPKPGGFPQQQQATEQAGGLNTTTSTPEYINKSSFGR